VPHSQSMKKEWCRGIGCVLDLWVCSYGYWILETISLTECASVYKRYSINTHQRDISAICRWAVAEAGKVQEKCQDTRTRQSNTCICGPANCLAS